VRHGIIRHNNFLGGKDEKHKRTRSGAGSGLSGTDAELLTECGKARWKIENEHNNVLKNHGYNPEHNFGHGKEHACEIYYLLNLLSFQFHGILQLTDEGYRKARGSFGRREEFFNG
jgi:hypothetical protein